GLLAARAREEGLIRESQSLGLRGSSQPWLQAAAAILLLLGGIAIGHTTVGLPSTAQPDGSNVVATPPAVTPAATQQTGASTGTANFASVEEASTALDRAVNDYKR